MMALVAAAPAANPYEAVKLVAGRWVNGESPEPEIACVRKSMRRFGASAPALGEPLKFVGKNGTMTAKIVGYLDGDKLPPQFPYVFANATAFAGLEAEQHGTVRFYRAAPAGVPAAGTDPSTPPAGTDPSAPQKLLTASSPEVIAAFKADEQKRMDYATPLLLAAAFLTALTLLINSLLLSIEAKRTTLATLRILGLTRSGVIGFVLFEALVSAIAGWIVGALGATGALAAWVAMDPAAFPAGMALDFAQLKTTLAVLPVIVFIAVLFTLRPALKVRPMDAAMRRPVPRRRGMAITFGCGFAAFVAVEVWGASLMRAFVPSAEWPDAIVSILPGGVSSFDVEKLRTVEGVKRISELVPRQCFFPAGKSGGSSEGGGLQPRRNGGRPPFGRPNALFLAAEWLPKFKFIEGTWEEASEALRTSDAVVITEMMMNAHRLHRGDRLTVETGGRRGPAEKASFPIAGVVDLNWHMVTSRGLVRGLNGAPGMTDGPVFCSFDTLGIVDPRTVIVEPAMSAPMTHLWVEYEPAFLARHGVFPAGRLIEAEIARRLGNPVGSTVRLHARDEIADGTLAHGSDIIGQAARVPFVFLAILAIGFVAMLVAEADARHREFVTLRAIGATKAQLAGRLTASAVRTALTGILVGVPLGSLVGWLFSLKTGNWPGLPHWFVLPADIVAEGALGALVFALVFAVPTVMILIGRATARSARRRPARNGGNRMKILALTLGCILAGVACAASPTDEAIARGTAFLLSKQQPDGHFSDPHMPALTALPLWALSGGARTTTGELQSKNDEARRKAARFVLSTQREDGGFYVPKPGRGGSGLGNYNTSVCLSALFDSGLGTKAALLKARTYIASSQLVGDDTMAGGFGYDKISRRRYADLSNTSYAMSAMAKTASLEEFRTDGKRADLDWDRAIAFVENLMKKDGSERGGAAYNERTPQAGTATNRQGRVHLRAYGSMTYAAVLSMCSAKLERNDPRVRQSLDYLTRFWSVDENPGMGSQGLYYFYDIMARALSAAGVEKVGTHEWKKELSAKLVSLQKPDGSWVNENNRFWEGDPVLCTSFALICLNLCR